MNEFRKFLNQFKCEKGQPFTHTSMGKGGGAGSYFIPRVRQGEFFEQYTREMIRPGALLHLTERPTDPSPMRTDLDFRFTLPADGVIARSYTRENIERIVTCYCAVIADYVQVMPDTPIVAYVLEKPDATEYRGKMKDGVHIIWPAVVVSHNVHHLIRKRVLDMSAELFHGMSICNDYEDVIDKAIIDKNNWQMYGSSKPDSDAYQVTAIYEWVPTRPEDLAATQAAAAAASEAAMEAAGGHVALAIAASASTAQLLEAAAVVAVAAGTTGGDRAKTPPPRLSVSSAGTLRPLAKPTATEELAFVELFSMRHKDDYVSIIRNEKVGEINEYIRHVLPATDERRANKLKSQIFANTMNYVRNFAGQEELSLARRLVLECLSQRRADNYEDWIKCGWALRNIDYRLLETWVEFSKMSSKYLDGQCQQLWDTMRTDTLGMGTLRWWARQDNPIRFKEIMDADTFTLVDRCAGSDGAHFDVAKVVHAMFKDRYRYATNDIWYVYMDHRHRWCRTKEGTKLREILSNDVFSKFVERALYWTQEGARSIDQREHFEERSKKMLKISNQLKSSGYKDSVMKECKCMFTDELFDQLLDSQPHLLCFENGVYDLKMHEFRDGLPDDYVSFCTKRYYIPYNPCSEEAQDIRMYFTQVFTNDSVRRYMMDLLASMVDGSMRQEKFYVFTGSGCHAIDTQILMYDGTTRAVQDVAVGDLLMGDDSTPRTVKELFRGTDVMYEIRPIKGEPFVVNQDHVLSLKMTNLITHVKRSDSKSPRWRTMWYESDPPGPDGLVTKAPYKRSKTFTSPEEAIAYKDVVLGLPNVVKMGDIMDLKVRDLLAWSPWWYQKGNATLYRPNGGIMFSKETEQDLALDPYMLGYWLGDGTSRGPSITTMDPEVVEYYRTHIPNDHSLVKYVDKKNNAASMWGIRYSGKRTGRYVCDNQFLSGLRKYELIQNKHIPYAYMVASREVRMMVLAGLLDSDGTYQKSCNQYVISQKSEVLMDGIIMLARSLGFASYKICEEVKCHNNGKVGTYYRTQIVGNGIEQIPCIIPRKQAMPRNKKKDPLLNSFTIAPRPAGPDGVADDRYFGFELDGNHRYLTGDFVVHHNSNSKSMVMQLVQKAVGEYYCILPIALLTQKRTASNSAQSELERTKGRRIAVMQEPGESERLNIGLMKELSGGDIIQCRGLFKEPIEFRPQFKMIMTCNELPEVPSDDGGTWRRIRVIEFTSKFTDTPDPKNNREFPMDSELTTKMDRWADTFISMILDHHSRMDAKNIVEPPEVRVATESYKKNNDVIGQFVNDCLRAEPDSPDRMQLQKGFTAFKMWANQVVPKGKKIPDRNQFRSYIEKLYGAYPSDGKGWKGVRCISGGDGGGDAEEEAAPPVTPTAAALAPAAAATPSKRAAEK